MLLSVLCAFAMHTIIQFTYLLIYKLQVCDKFLLDVILATLLYYQGQSQKFCETGVQPQGGVTRPYIHSSRAIKYFTSDCKA